MSFMVSADTCASFTQLDDHLCRRVDAKRCVSGSQVLILSKGHTLNISEEQLVFWSEICWTVNTSIYCGDGRLNDDGKTRTK